ncbi:MAG: TonB family protein [Roseibium sp.]
MKYITSPILIALLISGMLHLGGVALTLTSKPELEISGAGEVQHAVLGSSPFNTIISGTIAQAESAPPVEVEPQQATPVKQQNKPIVPEVIQAQKPVSAARSQVQKPLVPVDVQKSLSLTAGEVNALAVAITPEVQAEAPSAVSQQTPAEAKPVLPEPAPLKTSTEQSQKSVPVQDSAAQRKAIDATPVKPVPTPPVDLPSTQQVAEAQTQPTSENAVPTPVQKPAAPQRQKLEKTVSKTKPAASKKKKQKSEVAKRASQSGAGGKSKQTAQKGGSQRKGKAKTAGNSDVTNYPAKVHRKLLRSVRAPRGGGRRPKRDAVVRFTVQRNGSVSTTRLTRSSGSKPFDQAVLKAVGRAAPFPPIPKSAGRSNWTFTLPIGK